MMSFYLALGLGWFCLVFYFYFFGVSLVSFVSSLSGSLFVDIVTIFFFGESTSSAYNYLGNL